MKGTLIKVSGPAIVASGMKGSKIYDVVKVGKLGLIGEIIKLEEDHATVQVYEDTTGLKIGEEVVSTTLPLAVELGPGLLTGIFDGIQRPLEEIKKLHGDFIATGVTVPSLDRKKKWEFKPKAQKGHKVIGGDILGEVQETPHIVHKVMVPPNVSGTITELKAGSFTILEEIGKLDNGTVLKLMHEWPVRKARPYKRKLDPELPFLTGQRILDTLFPIALGGTAIIPGGFGTGKTVLEQTLAKFANADVIVYVGCGERGNEMTDVLTEFPALIDPKTGQPLMNRTILVVNTSNMPVAAREASIYTGITLAEYYRDMGYDVALMADSTSRWAEALREISSRLEEMPGEEGYPTYMATRLAGFYERAGRAQCIGSDENRLGSVTAVGAVSPPGGDFSEPVTQASLRITGAFWALDTALAYRRHFPAINWALSYTLYWSLVSKWFLENVSEHWIQLRIDAQKILQKDAELQEIVQLVGLDALSDQERILLESAKMIREDYLQQSAFHEVDGSCPPEKQFKMLSLLVDYYTYGVEANQKGMALTPIIENPLKDEISRMKEIPHDAAGAKIDDLRSRIQKHLGV
jgi:V/A-type H+/Na+-transporting ATPase subunit A